MTDSDDRPVNLKALADLPPDAPVVMVNLLKFTSGAGRDRYLQYMHEVQPHLARVGGTVRYCGDGPRRSNRHLAVAARLGLSSYPGRSV